MAAELMIYCIESLYLLHFFLPPHPMRKRVERSYSNEVEVQGETRPCRTYCVCGQIFFDIESVRPCYLYHWTANKMLLPMVYKTLV